MLCNKRFALNNLCSKLNREAAAEAAKLCADRGADIANLALRFSLENKQLSSTLVGMSTREVRSCNPSFSGLNLNSSFCRKYDEM